MTNPHPNQDVADALDALSNALTNAPLSDGQVSDVRAEFVSMLDHMFDQLEAFAADHNDELPDPDAAASQP
jgi:hypothetical protein